jgi:hypothetical protein
VWLLPPGLAKVEPAEEHRKARAMIDTLIRSASPNGATDGQTSTAVGGAPVRARPACDVGPGSGCGHSCTFRLCSAARPPTWTASKMTGGVARRAVVPLPGHVLPLLLSGVPPRDVPAASGESELGRENSRPRAGPPDYDESSARRDHQASAAVIALSASRMSPPTSPAVAAQCRGIRARAPGSQRCSSRVSGSGAVRS